MEIVAYVLMSISLISTTVANIILDKKIRGIKCKLGMKEATGLIYIAAIISLILLVILLITI